MYRFICRQALYRGVFLAALSFPLMILPVQADDPAPTDSAAGSATEIVFADIRLVGLVEYPDQGITRSVIDAAVQDTLAAHRQRLTLNAVKDVASRITSIYRSAGWVFTRAYVPAQQSTDGVVEVHLLQGYLDTVDVYDNKHYSEEEIRAPFAPYMGQPVFSNDIEEAVALINDMPGLNVFGFYSVGSEPGSTRLNLRVRQETEGRGVVRTDNHGSDLTGKARLYADWDFHRITDAPDRLKLAVLKSWDPDNADFGLFNYSRWLNGARDVVSFGAASTDYALGRGSQGTGALEISGESQTGFAQLQHKLRRSNRGNEQLYLRINRARSSSDSETFPEQLNTEQRSWTVTAGYSMDNLDRKAGTWNTGSIELTQGYYDDGVPAGQARDYHFLRGDFGYRMRTDFIDLPHQLELSMQLQYSPDIIGVTDQYSLTGADRLRGFEPSLFSADSALLLAMNWYFSSMDMFENNYATAITPYWFIDYGYGEQNAFGDADQWAEFSDIGAGISFSWQGGLRSKISIAKPMSSRISYTDDDVTASRLYVELIWQID